MGVCSQRTETELFSVRKQATNNFFFNTAAVFSYLYITQQLPPLVGIAHTHTESCSDHADGFSLYYSFQPAPVSVSHIMAALTSITSIH